MKKIIALCLSALCVLTLAACGGEEQGADSFALADLDTVVEKGAFSEELEELDADTAFMLYALADHGLAREDLTGAAVLRSAGATCEEGAVLLFADADKAAAAGEAMEDYLERQIETNVDYRPDEITKLEGATLQVKGSSLLMVVANDAAAVRNALG